MKQRISVQIAGITLHLTGDEPEEYVSALARMLNERYDKLSRGSCCGKYENLLLLCLELADERVKESAKRSELERQMKELTDMLA